MSSSIHALETSQPQNCTLALHGVFVVMGRHQYIYVINEHAWLFSTTEHCNQRSYQRWLDKRIYKTELKFWAVRGCREKKKLPTAISKQLFDVVFLNFLWAKKIFKVF